MMASVAMSKSWRISTIRIATISLRKKHSAFLILISILIFILPLQLLLSLTFSIPVTAEDLPIDITAINRQEAPEGQLTVRVGGNLFTRDSMRVNEALAEQLIRRQAIASYLFSEVPITLETEPHINIINAAYNSALFSQPVSFTNITLPQPDTPISIWIVVPIIGLCAIGGFIWALVSGAKKKRQADSAY